MASLGAAMAPGYLQQKLLREKIKRREEETGARREKDSPGASQVFPLGSPENQRPGGAAGPAEAAGGRGR